MSSLTIDRPNLARRLATLALLSFGAVAFAASDASAQSGGGIHGYFERFYGRDFYDGQHNNRLLHRDLTKVYHGGYYGPPMMNSRQYVQEYGYRTDPPLWFPRPSVPNPYNQGYQDVLGVDHYWR